MERGQPGQRVRCQVPVDYGFFVLVDAATMTLTATNLFDGAAGHLALGEQGGAVVRVSTDLPCCEVVAEAWPGPPPPEAAPETDQTRMELASAALEIRTALGDPCGALLLSRAGSWWLNVIRSPIAGRADIDQSVLLRVWPDTTTDQAAAQAAEDAAVEAAGRREQGR